MGTLRRRTSAIAASSIPAQAAERKWRNRNAAADREVERKLRSMVAPLHRCMYCEDSEGVDVEHFRPKSVYPLSTFEWTNLLLACSHCNSNEKRTQFPLSPAGAPMLVDPSAEDPARHLELSPSTGRVEPTTERGVATRDVFGLNRYTLEVARRTAWTMACALVVEYDRLKSAGLLGDAELVRRSLRRMPHGSVVDWLLRLARGPSARLLVRADVVEAVERNPELG